MENKNQKAVDALCELAQFVKDGNLGYKKAANETKDSEIKAFCNEQSSLRGTFLSEINSFITRLGGEIETSPTIKGTLYRQFMDVKAAVTGADDEGIINSCIFGEEWAIKAYHEALECDDLPVDVRSSVEKQHQTCHEALGKLKVMKNLHHH
jgi:uncharacterized protein (TIGR02284 family)